jgi:hypothetical protein
MLTAPLHGFSIEAHRALHAWFINTAMLAATPPVDKWHVTRQRALCWQHHYLSSMLQKTIDVVLI